MWNFKKSAIVTKIIVFNTKAIAIKIKWKIILKSALEIIFKSVEIEHIKAIMFNKVDNAV